MQQSGEQEPFVDEILRLLHRITVDLSPQQVSANNKRQWRAHVFIEWCRCTLSMKLLDI